MMRTDATARIRTAVVAAALVFVAEMTPYWRTNRTGASKGEVVVTVAVALIIAAASGERIVALLAWRTRRTRRPFEWNRNWVTAIVATTSAIGFGITGLLDTTPQNNIRSLVGLVLGATAISLVAAWWRLPIAHEARTDDTAHEPEATSDTRRTSA